MNMGLVISATIVSAGLTLSREHRDSLSQSTQGSVIQRLVSEIRSLGLLWYTVGDNTHYICRSSKPIFFVVMMF